MLYRNNRFQEPYYEKYFKEIKRLKSYQKAETYLKPKWASTMEIFLWKHLMAYYFRNKSSIIDVWLSYIYASKNIEIFKVKLKWIKSSRLLQRVAFLVLHWAHFVIILIKRHVVILKFLPIKQIMKILEIYLNPKARYCYKIKR